MSAPVPARRLLWLAPPLMAVVGLIGGCGGRSEAPSLNVIADGPLTEFSSEDDEVVLRHPRGWVAKSGRSPVVAQVTTGGANVSIYAYPRTDLGSDPALLEERRVDLIRSLRERAPGFLVLRTRLTEVDDSPAVEIRGRGTIAGRPVESRSVHVYKDEVEWVIDAYARPSQYDKANMIGFAPLISSIRLSDSVRVDPAFGEGG